MPASDWTSLSSWEVLALEDYLCCGSTWSHMANMEQLFSVMTPLSYTVSQHWICASSFIVTPMVQPTFTLLWEFADCFISKLVHTLATYSLIYILCDSRPWMLHIWQGQIPSIHAYLTDKLVSNVQGWYGMLRKRNELIILVPHSG